MATPLPNILSIQNLYKKHHEFSPIKFEGMTTDYETNDKIHIDYTSIRASSSEDVIKSSDCKSNIYFSESSNVITL